ncbi:MULTISPECIES: helix-turn-helix domain-containing protein [unclassified Sulfitobacter]|uniref:helix-turn-helix domain-containing protein n=1 Tax=unclassified Sulfitobacter TaxID=196795 RepID=UPI003745D6C5
MEPPRYLELAPPEEAAKQIDHLFVFRDTGVLSGGGHGRFATDLFTLSVTRYDSGGGRVSLAEPRPYFSPRPRPFLGVVAGLRLSSRPQRFPDSKGLDMLASELARVQNGDDDLPALIAVLDGLARDLRFAAPTGAYSDRTKRRKVRAETGVSRRRLATLRRFRRALGQLASKTLLLSDLALDAGYYDQSHLSAACRIFAGKPPGALRALSIPRRFDLSLQDTRLKDRLRLVIDE